MRCYYLAVLTDTVLWTCVCMHLVRFHVFVLFQLIMCAHEYQAHQRALGKKLKKGRGIEQAKGVAKALNVLGISEKTATSSGSVVAAEEECEGEEECFDITQSSFSERKQSLSTGIPPSLNAAAVSKRQRQVVLDERSSKPSTFSNEEECVDEEECFDITQNKFSERTKSLSTGLSPSESSKQSRANSKKLQAVNEKDDKPPDLSATSEEECEDEDDCFDITQSRFADRTQSLSTGFSPKNSRVEDFLPSRRSDGYYDITQNLFPEQRRASSTFSNLASGNANSDNANSNQNQDTAFFDITQNLFPEQPRSSQSASRLSSAFNEAEKSEMNSRPPPQSMDGSFVLDINKHRTSKDRSALSLSVNTGTVASKIADSLPAAEGTGSESIDREVSRSGEVPSTSKFTNSDQDSIPTPNDFVHITKQHFASERPSAYVNTTDPKRGSDPESESFDDYVDITKQHFPDRSSFSLLVNSGTKKAGTTYGSWDESRLLPTPERTKDASWRWRRTSKSEYLDKPRFSADLSPPSMGKPGRSESRQPLSATANTEPKQRFNTSEASYRDIVASSDRRPLSVSANAATQQRFNTSEEIYRDASTSVHRPPLSSTANAAPKQRFNTSDVEYRDSNNQNHRYLSSIAYAPPRQQFKTSERGFKDNPALSSRQPLNANAAPEQRFKTRERRDNGQSNLFSSTTKDLQPLNVHASNNRFNTVGKKTLLTSMVPDSSATDDAAAIDIPRAFKTNLEMVTFSPGNDRLSNKTAQHVDDVRFSAMLSTPSKVKNISISSQLVSSFVDESQFSTNLVGTTNGKRSINPKLPNNAEPLSLSIHSAFDRFNTTKKSSSSFSSQPVGFDVPRAFVRNIDMVTKSEVKRGGKQLADTIEFSSNLSESTTIKNLTKTEGANNDTRDNFNPDPNLFSPILSESTSIRILNYTQSTIQSDDTTLVDKNHFSQDLSRVSTAGVKHKPGSSMKSTPHNAHDEISGIDLNKFSSVSDLCPPSKVKMTNARNQTESSDQLLDLTNRQTVNTIASKTARGTSAVVSDDPFIDVPQFSEPETLTGPLRVKDLTRSPATMKGDIMVDDIQFSPASKLRPPSQVRHLQPKDPDLQEPQKKAPHINPYFEQFVLGKRIREKMPQNEVTVDRFLDLSSQYTVNNSSMTALGSHAIMSDDPYVDVARFSNPKDLSPPSKVHTYRDTQEHDYFDITQASLLSSGSLTRNVSSVRDAISATKPRMMDVDRDSSSLLRNTSSVKDAMPSRKHRTLYSAHEEVQGWLRTRLPHLDDQMVKSYAKQLVIDGFDSVDVLEEIISEDLDFMDEGDVDTLTFFIDLKYWLLAYLPDLNHTDIASYSEQLISDGFDSFEMLDELTKEDINFMKPSHRHMFTKQLTDLHTDSSSADRDEEESFDITRHSFPERPSLASDPSHHLTSIAKNENTRMPADVEDDEEESFDITRASFPDRPSLATAQQCQKDETPVVSEHNKRVSEIYSNPPTSIGTMEVKQQSNAPKADLYNFYTRKGFTSDQASELNDFYTVWESRSSSQKRFTSVFTCPISGEHFFAGNWKEGGDIIYEDSLFWYRKLLKL